MLSKKLNSLTLTVILVLASGCQVLEKDTATTTQKQNIYLAIQSLDAQADYFLKKTHIPGIAIAVVHNNEVIYARGFGVREVGSDLKVTPDTVFQLASLSKSLAATVVAGAVGSGSVKWTDPIQKYLPDFTLSNPEAGAKVTIADMFAHRSGLPSQAGDALESFGCKREEIIHRLKYLPLKPLGTTYNYSNFGLTTGAEAVAVANKMPWEDLAKNILYNPLGMHSSSSRWSDYDARPNKAILHVRNKDGNWVPSARQPDEQSPAGGVSSSANDMAKWMMLVLNDGADQNGKQIISKEALTQTEQKEIKMPPDANFPNRVDYYGLGIIVEEQNKEWRHLKHSGAFSAGASTTFDLLPSQHLGIAILTNGMPIGVPETIAQQFYDIVEYGELQNNDYFEKLSAWANQVAGSKEEPNSKQKNLKPTSSPNSSGIIGTYHNDFYGEVTIKAVGKELKLTLKPCSSEQEITLTHSDGNTFYFPIDAAANEFHPVYFEPAKGGEHAKIKIEFLNQEGLVTFKKM